MMSCVELGTAVLALFLLHRRNFEFIFERIIKGSVTHPALNPMGYQELLFCGDKDDGA